MSDLLSAIKDKATAEKILERLKSTKINVLLIGGTGVGKSSTIDALFRSNDRHANVKIGDKTSPETMEITQYEMENLVIWDSPGLGDSPEKDKVHKNKIIKKLHEKDAGGQPLIDLVFLIIDAGSRDFGSAYTLVKEVVLPNVHGDDRDRLLVGINQADQALKGHYWNKEENRPEPKLAERLDELVKTVKERIQADTDLEIEPICYSAGCIMDGEVLSHPYNLQKLLSFIMDRLPKKKRAAIAMHVNENEQNFRSNDGKEDYAQKVDFSIWESIKATALEVLGAAGKVLKDHLTDPENIKAAVSFIIKILAKK
jgi:predicted GTPase